MLKRSKLFFIILIAAVFGSLATFFIIKSKHTVAVPITLFPLENYSQNIDRWIDPSDLNYDKILIPPTEQKKHVKNLYNHLYATGEGALSPWNKKFVEKRLDEDETDPLEKRVTKEKLIEKFGDVCDQDGKCKDRKKIGYGANFRPYDESWLNNVIRNMNLEQFILPAKFSSKNRGIAVKNIMARSLPSNDPYFWHFSLPGEGYPFDNIQASSIWVGTPIYIIGKTLDHKWSLILTPSYLAWVESDGIASVNEDFIKKWQTYAKQNMAAINKTNVSVFDTNDQYRFNAYIGTMFPVKSFDEGSISVLIPVADDFHNARIFDAKISKDNANIMPLPPTPRNFAKIISSLKGRPYGWGNMYFYNDCSAELKNLYTPFGIYLPRNSSRQAKSMENKMIDLSKFSVKDRLKYLRENGKKFITVIFIGGHVMMYIGNFPSTKENEPMVMTYQNIWGLAPKDRSYRSIIGQSVFFPLLETYPENTQLNSLADKRLFQIFNLDEL